MQGQSPSKNQPSSMLSAWRQLEAFKVAADTRTLASQSAAIAPLHPPVVLPPCLKTLDKRPSRDTLACVGAPVAGSAADLSSTPPKLTRSQRELSTDGPRDTCSASIPTRREMLFPSLTSPHAETFSTPRCGQRVSRAARGCVNSVRKFHRMFNSQLSKMADSMSDWVDKASLRSARHSPGKSLRGKLDELLNRDLQTRVVNPAVDVHVDLLDARYVKFIEDAATAQFVQNWRQDKASSEASEKYPAAHGQLTKTFLRDFDVTHHRLRHPDGRHETVQDPLQIVEFIGPGEVGNLPERVSHVANQNLTVFLHRVLFTRRDASGNYDSALRLADGTPVAPRGAMEVTCTYGKQADGTIILWHEMRCARKPDGAPLSVLKSGEIFGAKQVSDHAKLHVTTQISFSPNGEWHVADPHVRASGWNQTSDA